MLESGLQALAAPTVEPVGSALLGLGWALPEKAKDNHEVAANLDVDADWIRSRTGVVERRVASGDESLVDLASRAGRRALIDADVAAADIDLVVVATCTHDMIFPATAPLVADRLGVEGAGAFDVNSACNGFMAGLAIAVAQVESGRAGSVLLIGADLMHRLVDPEDRTTAGIFGDGAGAVVVGKADRGRVGPVILGSSGNHGHLVEAGRAEAIIRMKGQDTFRLAVDQLVAVTETAVARAESKLDAIDLFVYHQANGRITRAVGERLGLDARRVVDCVDRFGNTSAGSIPIALEQARSEGRLHAGDSVLLAGFGSGLTWGASVVEWGSE